MKRGSCLALVATLSPGAVAFAGPAPTLSDPDNQPVMLTVEVEAAPQNLARQQTPQISPLLYINPCEGGCTIRAGDVDDARQNISSIPDERVELSEFQHSAEVFESTVECVNEVLQPYDIEVVTRDPGTQSHHAAIIAGTAEELGLQSPDEGAIGGVAPLANDCRPLDNVMSFTFANTLQDNATDLCWTIVHEAGHAYGLDHVFACEDPMTYLTGCGTKFFRDEALQCGEFEERSCQCGGSTQNSHEVITQVFGEGTLPPPPDIAIVNLQAGDEIDDGADVAITASHDRGIRRVALRVNGTLYNERAGNGPDEGDTYRLTLPQHPDGVLNIEAVAYNDLEIAGSDEVTVTKGEPCSSDEDCFEGMDCSQEGACTWPPPDLELGEPCEHERECISGLCPSAGGERYCSEICEVGAGECPAGLECREAGEQGACWPEGAASGCGCAAAGGGTGVPILSLGLLVFGACLSRRRRRARA